MSRPNIYGSTRLTARERRVVDLVWLAFPNAAIAAKLGTTEMVIKNYLRIIYDKTGQSNRTELALWWEMRRPSNFPQ